MAVASKISARDGDRKVARARRGDRKPGRPPVHAGGRLSEHPKPGNLPDYSSNLGVDAYVVELARATPLQLIEVERRGVRGGLIKDLARRMDIPSTRFYKILGLAKATAEKKAAADATVGGRGGQAAIGMAKLLNVANEIVASSTREEAQSFDAARWLGRWIETPQPALAGRKPAELLDTTVGTEVVVRLLGAIESGAYQ